MSFINYVTKEVNCKIIYYGAGLSGKTTNVQYIYEHTHTDQKGKLVSLGVDNERTLFFDFLPLSVGEIQGFKARFHLYTIPGQTFYETSRQFILKGVDGIVFVVDSQTERMEANLESFENLEKNLKYQGYDLHSIPLVFQYNKRDLSEAVPIPELETTFNPGKRPYYGAVAYRGDGVMETLESVSHRILQEIKRGET